jgi:regulator of sigma E protease
VTTILQFIIVLGLLLFLHESGHYLIARLLKIEVEEFGFGFPPRLAKLFTYKGTDFTLNWIPFGAFVRPKGENDPNIPGGLGSASPWVRLGVLLGGPVMNILTGIIIFTAMFIRIGAPNPSTVQVIEVSPNSPAAAAGIEPFDLIKTLDGQAVDSMEKLSSLVQQNLDKEITLVLDRDGQPVEISIVPRANPPENEGPLGISMSNAYESVTLFQAIPAASATAAEQARQLFLLPGKLITGQVSSQESRMVGPKGMFDIYAEASRRDAAASGSPIEPAAVNVLFFVGTISVALGLTNLLPIPALDGGRIIFLLPELLFHKRIPARYENAVHLIGFAALLLLMGYITFQDFANPILRP